MSNRNFENLSLIINDAPGLIKATSSTAAASGGAVGSYYFGLDQWFTIASMGLAVVGLVFTGVSIWVAYARLIEQRKTNKLKEIELKIKKL